MADVGRYMPIISALRRWRQATCSYIVSSRPAWDTKDLCKTRTHTQTKKKEEIETNDVSLKGQILLFIYLLIQSNSKYDFPF